MACEVCRAPGRRSARRAAHPEMAECRRAGGWETNTCGGRDAPGRKCLAAFGERHESTGAVSLSVPGGMALASRVVATQPEWPHPLGPHAASHHSLAAFAYRLSSLSSPPYGRPHLRQEPDAVAPLVRIRGGGCDRSHDPYSDFHRARFAIQVRVFVCGDNLHIYTQKKVTGSRDGFPQLHRRALFQQDYSRSSPALSLGPTTCIP